MADSKLLVPELSEAEKMGAETARFEELLRQVRTDRLLGPGSLGILGMRACVYTVYMCVRPRVLRDGTTFPDGTMWNCSWLAPSLLGSGRNAGEVGLVHRGPQRRRGT